MNIVSVLTPFHFLHIHILNKEISCVCKVRVEQNPLPLNTLEKSITYKKINEFLEDKEIEEDILEQEKIEVDDNAELQGSCIFIY